LNRRNFLYRGSLAGLYGGSLAGYLAAARRLPLAVADGLAAAQTKPGGTPPSGFTAAELRQFRALEAIDTHTHVFGHPPAYLDLLRRLNFHAVDILVVSDESKADSHLEPRRSQALGVVGAAGGRVKLCTAFNPYRFNEDGFPAEAVKQVNGDFARGAIAMKIWKNVGMEVKDKAGKFIQADNPRLEPIYRDLVAQNRTMIAHLAEPSSCWQPPNPKSPDYGYYNSHPEWYMYLHPDHPKKATILAARDHVLAMNPHLRVVGAHLGSMETDVDMIAARFDRYPNFAVDTAARIQYLMSAPREKVRDFLIKYQDRVTYGTDLEWGHDSGAGPAGWWEETYARHWRFFATGAPMQYKGLSYTGLQLPHEVLRKLYHDNAAHWFPGIV
jgi:predicted TIM-barrel fold metal-dependent hydrolase